jgi:hypothetical protein
MDLWAMDRWVGGGITANNLIDIGRVMEHAAKPQSSSHHRNFKPAGRPCRLCFARQTTTPPRSQISRRKVVAKQ